MDFSTYLMMTMMHSLLNQTTNNVDRETVLSEIRARRDSFKRLVWHDEFNGQKLNDDDWIYEEHCGRFNKELQCYTKHRTSNVRLSNGHLIIQARPERYHKYNFTSGRLLTRKSWRFGRFDISARMPKGKHLWPAIWMLAKHETYGTWPTNGEIDITEVIGDNSNSMSSSIHYGPTEKSLQSMTSGVKHMKVDLSKKFHLYSLEWTPKRLTWLFDDKPYYWVSLDRLMCCKKSGKHRLQPKSPYKKAGQPFDQPFFMILNVAVGGTFFGPPPYVTRKQAERKWIKNTFEIDYIRVYQ